MVKLETKIYFISSPDKREEWALNEASGSMFGSPFAPDFGGLCASMVPQVFASARHPKDPQKSAGETQSEDGEIPGWRMYKDKIAEWGFAKYLKREWVGKIAKASRQRESRSNGQNTVVVVGNQTMPLRKVRESYARQQDSSMVERPPTCLISLLKKTKSVINPAALPSTLPGASSQPPPPAARTPLAKEKIDQAWTPSYAACNIDNGDASVLRTEWRGMSLGELSQLKVDAAAHDQAGDLGDAEYAFRDALAGFRHLLSSCHEFALKAGYHLATFYANHSRMPEADGVLNWMSENIVRKHGLGHMKTVEHYVIMVELLQAWSREEHAEVLLFRVGEGLDANLDDNTGTRTTVPTVPWNERSYFQESLQRLDPSAMNRIFPATENEAAVDTRLRIVDLWLASNSPGDVEQVLNRLVQQCEQCPKKLDVQALKARCRLVKLQVSRGDTASDKNTMFITYLIQTGVEFQRRSGWEDAAEWFGRAYGLCIRIFAAKQPRTRSLEETIAKRRYDIVSTAMVEKMLTTGAGEMVHRIM
ncbi:hypothetical protein MKZ38_000171 [Zalerion maritima]|uniref:Uncharacterized protein n=1 Tax=Zalerion maritima TaxID=339359 RepID=A0AAD5RTG4_9PEZI|nr:hypothetical protein MKZ38_000171 [Zalerion maritima]